MTPELCNNIRVHWLCWVFVTWTCFGFLWVGWYIVFVALFIGMMIFSYFYTCLLTTGNLFRFGFTFVASFIIQLLFHLFGFWYIQSFGLFTFVLFFHSVFLFLFVCLFVCLLLVELSSLCFIYLYGDLFSLCFFFSGWSIQFMLFCLLVDLVDMTPIGHL